MTNPLLHVFGGRRLFGSLENEGSKNAGLAILAATALGGPPCEISRVPACSDILDMVALLRSLGLGIRMYDGTVKVRGTPVNHHVTGDAVARIRHSFLLAGSLLAARGRVVIGAPGGCAIGARPVDLHLKGFTAMGASWSLRSDGSFDIQADRLRGADITLGFPSVGATMNLLLAATGASGTTTLSNAAREPEVIDLAQFLRMRGAHIRGEGTATIEVEGTSLGNGGTHTLIPDRIAVGTYAAIGLATGSDLTIHQVVPAHLATVLAKLKEMGAHIAADGDKLTVRPSDLVAADIATAPYPGFPTDLQPIFTSLLCLSRGTSIVTETIFEDRLRHADQLRKMGSRIETTGNALRIKGSTLVPAQIQASDLRGVAGLLVAALAARGQTTIHDAGHLSRGYPHIMAKLDSIGAWLKWG